MNTIFYNADYIVVEYIDLIKSPYFILLDVIRQNPRMKEILKIEDIQYLNEAALYEWYINRRHQNFLIDLNKYPDKVPVEKLEELLEDQLQITERFYTNCIGLPMIGSLKAMKMKGITNDVIIYHPHHNEFAKNDLEGLTGERFIWIDTFKEVLRKAGSNSTYFLSDINHIEEMKKYNVLKFSSVTLPFEYRYNKKNMKDFNLDYEKLMETDPFKLSYMYACRYEHTGGN